MKYEMTKDESIIRELAKHVVDEADPGFSGHGHYYVDLESWAIHYAESNRAWNPWADSAVVVSCDDCFDLKNIDASGRVNWREVRDLLKSWSEILQTYCEENDAREDNGDLADWVDFNEVIEWAREESEEWEEEITNYEDASFEAAVDLIETCVLEFVEVE